MVNPPDEIKIESNGWTGGYDAHLHFADDTEVSLQASSFWDLMGRINEVVKERGAICAPSSPDQF